MKTLIEAARLRTLPLSVSGIIVGSMYALANPTDTILTPTEVLTELFVCYIDYTWFTDFIQFCQ
jgi:1,4-dihydroxy-2-naphthoate octaprenyltransferase